MKDETREALRDSETWARGLTYLLFFALLILVSPFAILVSLYGWLMLLWTGRTPEQVVEFGATLADWYHRTLRYITANGVRRPFPFEDLDCPRDEPEPSRGSEARSGASSDARQGVSSSPSKPAPVKSAVTGLETTGATDKPPAASKKAGKKASKKTTRKTAGKTVKKARKKVGKKATKKVAKKSTRKVAEKPADQSAAKPTAEQGSAVSGADTGSQAKRSEPARDSDDG